MSTPSLQRTIVLTITPLWVAALLVITLAVGGLLPFPVPVGAQASGGAAGTVTLTNVSYDPTRELYEEVNTAFAKQWQARTGQAVKISASHGGSGKQARAVIDGL